MQDTAANSSLYSPTVKCSQIVPECQKELNDNLPIDSKETEGMDLKKRIHHIGITKQNGHSRELHIQQVNESFLYDDYGNKKEIETGIDVSEATTMLGHVSGRNSFDGTTDLDGGLEKPKDNKNPKNNAMNSQLDGLKDINSIASILSKNCQTLSPRTDVAQSQLSSEKSFSPATCSFSTHEDLIADSIDKYDPSKTNNLTSEEKSLFEKDKKAIYRHPLFPLLSTLFEKCEIATKSIELSTTYNFNADAQSFIEQKVKDKKEIACEDNEVNELMIRALQVLRIHLLELEKVQDLCKDFCNRYITCLRGKMHSENLLRTDYGGYDSDDSGSGGSVGKEASLQSMSPMPSIA